MAIPFTESLKREQGIEIVDRLVECHVSSPQTLHAFLWKGCLHT